MKTNESSEEKVISEVQWLGCGPIECGKLSVLVDHDDNEHGLMTISVYRKAAADIKAPILLLLTDDVIDNSARSALEKSKLTFGVAIQKFTVVSMAIRGAIDAVMPTGSEKFMGALDIADDIEALRGALGVKKLSVIAWGSGATAAASWVMQNPQSADRVVLDSPEDPSVPLEAQDSARVIAMSDAVSTAMRWCASHLSCTMNATVSETVKSFKKKMMSNSFGKGVTLDALARVAQKALTIGRPIDLFESISQVAQGDDTQFLLLAGSAPTLQTVQRECRNATHKDAMKIASNHVFETNQTFPLGDLSDIYNLCMTLPESGRPIGALIPKTAAIGASVMVTTAVQDPMWSASTVSEFSKKMKWTYKPVKVSRHLAIGYERSITVAALTFLQSK